MSSAHHAYVYYDQSLDCLEAALAVPGPDVFHISTERLSIHESRKAIALAQQRPVSSAYISIVLHFAHATLEAQNALLKLLEEPPATTRIFIIVPGPERLIATIHSRVVVAGAMATTSVTQWPDFCSLALREQLSEIAERSKNLDGAWQCEMLEAAVRDNAVAQATRSLIDENDVF